MQTVTQVQVPELEHDAQMLAEFNHPVTAEGRLERRIVANLIAHMAARGLDICAVHDYEEEYPATDAKAAMELVFNLDGCNLHFKGKSGRVYVLVLVLGNGVDIVSDWFVPKTDIDGFDQAAQDFDAERFA